MTTETTEQNVESNVAAPQATEPEATTGSSTISPILAKTPTALHRRLALWLHEKHGFTPEGAEVPTDYADAGNQVWEDFVKATQLLVTQYGAWQKSPENAELRAIEAQRKEELAEAAKAEKQKKAAEKAAKAAADAEAAKAKAASTPTPAGDDAKARKATTKSKANAPEAPF